MRLERIRIAGIAGRREPILLEAGDGCTVALGGNESGKTAAVWALARAFAGPDPGHYYTTDEQAEVEVLFRVGAAKHQVVRDLHSGEVSWSQIELNETKTDLYRGSGGDQSFADLVETHIGQERLAGWLQELVSGPDGGKMPAAARRSDFGVEERTRRHLVHRLAEVDGSQNAPGELQVIQEEIERQRQRFSGWEQTSLRGREIAGKLTELEAKIDEAERAAEARDEVLATLTRFQDLGQEVISLDAELVELEARKNLVKHHAEDVEKADSALEAEFGDFLNAGHELEEALQNWTDATSRLHDLQRRLHVVRQALAAAPKTNTVKNGIVTASVLGLLSFLACFGAGELVAGILVGPLLAALGFGAIWAKNRSSETVRMVRRQEIDLLEEESVTVEAEVDDIKAGMGALGHLGHPMAIRKAVIQYWKAREGVEKLRRERDRHPPLTEVVENHQQALDRRRQIEQEMKALTSGAQYLVGLDANRDSLAGEVDMARAQSEASQARVDRLIQERAGLLDERGQSASRHSTLGQEEREYRDLLRHRHELEAESQALRICVETLDETMAEHHTGMEERINESAGRLLTAFSLGHWTAVQFPAGGDTMIRDAEGQWVPVAHLSAGARAQADLAVRLAADEASGPEHSLPLVLDEPFTAWDRQRLEAARDAIRGHAERGGQILILSYDDRFSTWGDSVIHIEPPPAIGNGTEDHRTAA